MSSVEKPAVYTQPPSQPGSDVAVQMKSAGKGDLPDGQPVEKPCWTTRAGIIVSVLVGAAVIVIVVTTSVLLTREKAADSCSEYEFVSRADWGARDPQSPLTTIPRTNMTFLHHTAAGWECSDKEKCIADVKSVQNLHIDANGWNDIGYNFLVGEDGRVYEGRGWLKQGAHAPTYNSLSHGICIIGDYMERMPAQVAMDTAKALIRCGVEQGYIQENYELFGHRDGRCTLCPGDQLYADLQSWPHYSTRDIPIVC